MGLANAREPLGAIGRNAKSAGWGYAGRYLKKSGPASGARVAGAASGRGVLGCHRAAVLQREEVVEGEVFGVAAVDAAIAVAGEDVGAEVGVALASVLAPMRLRVPLPCVLTLAAALAVGLSDARADGAGNAGDHA